MPAAVARRPPRSDVVAIIDLHGRSHERGYDVVTCMEVLEHCVDAERVRVLDYLRESSSPRAAASWSAFRLRSVLLWRASSSSVPSRHGAARATTGTGKRIRLANCWRRHWRGPTLSGHTIVWRHPPARSNIAAQGVRLADPRTGDRSSILHRAPAVHAPGPPRRAAEQPGVVRLRPALVPLPSAHHPARAADAAVHVQHREQHPAVPSHAVRPQHVIRTR